MKTTLMLPMNEQDKSERIEWLLSTMNCAQKQLTHTAMSGKLGRPTQLKSAGRESQIRHQQWNFFHLLLFPRAAYYFQNSDQQMEVCKNKWP